MLKYALLIALALPAHASFAADYNGPKPGKCKSEQWGNHYCVIAPPIEKLITNCDPGVDCHHMQSGQHYSSQRPVVTSVGDSL